MRELLKNSIGKVLCTAAAAVTAITLSLPTPATAAESSDPIKLAINEWTGQHITTYIAGGILEKMGYNVEYVVAGYYPQLTALQDGTVDASLEIWTSNIGEGYAPALATGNVEVIGELGLVPREAWYYPTYMEEQCPGLPDWKALNDCAMLFSAPETIPKGRFVDYPAEWGTTNVSRIDALDLNYASIPAGSEGAIIAEIKSAYATKQPLLTMFWEPHWVHAVYDLTILELPVYDDACYEDASWGTNPDKTYDCDWDASATIEKIIWTGMKDKWPGAVKMLTAYKFYNSDQAILMKAVDNDGEDILEVTAEWIKNNEAKWKPWTM